MLTFPTQPEWLDIVKSQEEALVFQAFGHKEAIEIGLIILKLAEEKYHQSVAMSIEIDHTEVFACMMPGTTPENKDWIRRKVNTAKHTGVSTLNVCLQAVYGGQRPAWLAKEAAYVACGGGWPVGVKGEDPFAYIMVSGLEHHLDHQIIVDALSAYLKITVASIG